MPTAHPRVHQCFSTTQARILHKRLSFPSANERTPIPSVRATTFSSSYASRRSASSSAFGNDSGRRYRDRLPKPAISKAHIPLGAPITDSTENQSAAVPAACRVQFTCTYQSPSKRRPLRITRASSTATSEPEKSISTHLSRTSIRKRLAVSDRRLKQLCANCIGGSLCHSDRSSNYSYGEIYSFHTYWREHGEFTRPGWEGY